MANRALSELGRRLPQIALAYLAAKKGGPEGFAAFQQGVQQSDLRRQATAQQSEALARQAQMDEEARSYRAQQMALQQRQLESVERRAEVDDARMAAAEARQTQEDKARRAMAAVNWLRERGNELVETVDDPESVERTMAGEAAGIAQLSGVEPDLLHSRITNQAPAISKRLAENARLWAKEIVEDVRAASVRLGQPLTDETVSMAWDQVPEPAQRIALSHGHQEGQPFKLSQFEQLAALPSFRMSEKANATGLDIDKLILTADQRGDEAEIQRLLKLKTQIETAGRAPDNGGSGGTPYYTPIQTAGGVVSFDNRTGKVTGRIADLRPGESAQRELAIGQTVIGMMDRILTGLTPDKIGPVMGRFKTVEAAITGGDQTFATLAAQTAQLQNVVINLRTGAAMSEPEAARIMAELPSVTLPADTYVARLKNAHQYYREYQKNRSTLAFGRTTDQGVTEMTAPATPSVPPPPPATATYQDYLRSRGQ